jgi:hypothetical protein
MARSRKHRRASRRVAGPPTRVRCRVALGARAPGWSTRRLAGQSGRHGHGLSAGAGQPTAGAAAPPSRSTAALKVLLRPRGERAGRRGRATIWHASRRPVAWETKRRRPTLSATAQIHRSCVGAPRVQEGYGTGPPRTVPYGFATRSISSALLMSSRLSGDIMSQNTDSPFSHWPRRATTRRRPRCWQSPN